MKKMSSMQQSIKQQMNHLQQPQQQQQQQQCQPASNCCRVGDNFDYPMKEEPAAGTEITEIDSGCESPQEQASPMVNKLKKNKGPPCEFS